MLGMIISKASSTFRVLGSRSRLLWLFLEKLCLCSSAYIYQGLIISQASFNFEGLGLKVKDTVAFFCVKIIVIALAPTLIDEF